jgi:hypothetical protein
MSKFGTFPVWFVAFLVIATTGGCGNQPTPQDVSVEVQRAIEESDSEKMASFVSDEEVKMLGVKRDVLKEFFVRELFDAWVAKGEPYRHQDSYDTVTVVMPLESKSGDQKLEMAIFSMPGDDGVDVPNLIRVVVWHNAMAAARKEGRPTDPASRLRIISAYLKENGSRLESTYGLKGLYFDGDGSVVSWADIQRRYREKANQIDEQRKSAGSR